MNALFAFVYLCLGLIVAVPYNWLAHGTIESTFFTALIAPIAIFILIYSHATSYSYSLAGTKRRGWEFWICCIFFTLPISMNFASRFLTTNGYAETGRIIFALRYGSMGIVLALLTLYVVTITLLEDLRPSSTDETPAPVDSDDVMVMSDRSPLHNKRKNHSN